LAPGVQFQDSLRKVTHSCDAGGFNAAASLFVLHGLVSRDWVVARATRGLLPQGCHSLLRLDYISCALTVLSTVLVGRRLWQGWMIAGANSVIICIIGIRTSQVGFVPANLFCIALYVYNLLSWRKFPIDKGGLSR